MVRNIPDTSSVIYSDKNYSSLPKQNSNNIKVIQGDVKKFEENKI